MPGSEMTHEESEIVRPLCLQLTPTPTSPHLSGRVRHNSTHATPNHPPVYPQRGLTPAADLVAEGWVLLDVRPPGEVGKVGIQGAVNVPLFVEDPSNSVSSLIKKAATIGTGGWWLGGTHMIPYTNFLAEVGSVCEQGCCGARVLCGVPCCVVVDAATPTPTQTHTTTATSTTATTTTNTQLTHTGAGRHPQGQGRDHRLPKGAALPGGRRAAVARGLRARGLGQRRL